MKKLTMFHFEGCPFCAKAEGYMKELIAENPEYGKVEISRIDEKKHPDEADLWDYYFVPTFFMGEEKLHEGIINKEQMKQVLDTALNA